MKNNEENFDEGESSDGEGSKPGFEALLNNPAYLSSTMKVRKRIFLLYCEIHFCPRMIKIEVILSDCSVLC